MSVHLWFIKLFKLSILIIHLKFLNIFDFNVEIDGLGLEFSNDDLTLNFYRPSSALLPFDFGFYPPAMYYGYENVSNFLWQLGLKTD